MAVGDVVPPLIPAASKRSVKTDVSKGTTKTDVTLALKHEGNPEMRKLMNITMSRVAQEEKTVSLGILKDYIEERRQHSNDCAQFPFMIGYFVLFVVMVFFHEDITNVSQVERNFRAMMEGSSFEGTIPNIADNGAAAGKFVSGHKIMKDIDGLADIYTYLYDAVTPMFIPTLDSVKPRDLNRVLRYNQLIGGIQLQQIRREKVQCVDAYPNLGPKNPMTDENPLLLGFWCYPWDQHTNECFGSETWREGWCPDNKTSSSATLRLLQEHDKTGFIGKGTQSGIVDARHKVAKDWMGRRLQKAHYADKVRGKEQYALGGYENAPGLYTVTLHEHEGLAVAMEKIKYLQANKWLDDSTAWFGIKIFILNPDLGVYTHVIMNVWFPPSGELIPAVTMSSFLAAPYQYGSVISTDICFGIFWLHLFVMCVVGLIKSIMKKKTKQYLSNFWNWLNWGSALGGLLLFVLWFMFLGKLATVQDKTMEVVLKRPGSSDGSGIAFSTDYQKETYVDATADLHREVAALSGFLMNFRLFVCWYTIGIMARFFQAFLAQPKLAVVTRTVLRSLPDMLHFMIVLMLVFLAYSVAGMFLFGHRLLMFSQMSYAIQSCFLIMLGDFDYDELSSEHLVTSACWFLTFMVLVALIMLNMLLAIVMDVYSEVKAEAENSEPIWEQLANTISDMWEKREYLKLSIVQEALDRMEMADDKKISKDELLRQAAGMSVEQAEELIDKADKIEEDGDNKGLKISDAMKMVGWIKLAVQKIAGQIEEIMFLEKDEKKMLIEAGRPLHVGKTEAPVGGRTVDTVKLHPKTDTKLVAIDTRLAQMDEFLNENMCYTVHSGKEMRNRLTIIETLLKGEQHYSGGRRMVKTKTI